MNKIAIVGTGHEYVRSMAREVVRELGEGASAVEYGTALHERIETMEIRCSDPYMDRLLREVWRTKNPEHRDKLIRYMHRTMSGR